MRAGCLSMKPDALSRISLAVLAAIGISIAAYMADAVLAPLALAIFIVALVWPLQRWLQERVPALIALAATMALTVLGMVVFASLVVWGFGRVGRSILAELGPLPGALRHGRRLARQPRRLGRRDSGPNISTLPGF